MMGSGAELLPATLARPRLSAPGGAILGVSVAGAIVVGVGLGTASPQTAAIGMMVLLSPLLIALLLRPVWAFRAWLFATAAFNVILFQVSVSLGARLYLLDLFALVAALAAVIHSRQHGVRLGTPATERTTALLIVVIAFAALQTARGAFAGHDLSDTLGTLRRLFVYPVAGFLIAYAFLRSQSDIRALTTALWSACAALAAVLAYRVVTGSGYRAEAFEANQDVVRYLSYPETVTLITGAVLGFGLWIWTPRRGRWAMWPLVAFGCFAMVIVSNYRTSWLALAIGLLCGAAAVAARSPRRSLRLLGAAGIGGGLLVALLLLTPLHELLARKLSAVNLAQTGAWRWFSWLHAWRVFREHPWLGVGLGYRHAFWTPDAGLQSGALVAGNEIHNDALWILVNAGSAGLLLWLAIAGMLIANAFRALRSLSDPDVLAMLCAACGQIGAVALTAMLQPTLSLGGTGVWVGTLGALFVRAAQWSRDRVMHPVVAPGAA